VRYIPYDSVFSNRVKALSQRGFNLGSLGPDVISLVFGSPDPGSLPALELSAIAKRVLEQQGQDALSYQGWQGYGGLRQVIA
jgi:DNA-binding transcriptional MocR family regulator